MGYCLARNRGKKTQTGFRCGCVAMERRRRPAAQHKGRPPFPIPFRERGGLSGIQSVAFDGHRGAFEKGADSEKAHTEGDTFSNTATKKPPVDRAAVPGGVH